MTGTNPTFFIDTDNLPALEVVRIYNPYNPLFYRLPHRQGPKSTTGDKRQKFIIDEDASRVGCGLEVDAGKPGRVAGWYRAVYWGRRD